MKRKRGRGGEGERGRERERERGERERTTSERVGGELKAKGILQKLLFRFSNQQNRLPDLDMLFRTPDLDMLV